ncbi:MAG: CZB domain-containing protein [Rhodocyclaceae bacterium]|nr:CZB domain-containing protein [Rhodocyclaceae bacterium]
MSALDWFKRILGQKADEAAPPAPAEASMEVAGLNFMTAIEAHIKWKTRLETYIQGTSQEDLKVETVCRDDQCPLGKWIYSTGGERFGTIDTFGEMKGQHALFHQCAGRVLETAQQGKKEEAMRLLQYGDYVRASEQVKRLLAKLSVRLNAGT